MRLDDQDEFVIVINFSNRPVMAEVSVMNAQEFKPITPCVKETPAGFPLLALKGFEYRIYHRHMSR
ncbi:MAG: Alpha amylase catalytic region [Pedosphaera sp.]|nr:Alpha amylase catalytic region [Pedosphaera sp.]